MDVAPADAISIDGQQLTAWAVLPGGTRIRLDVTAADGSMHRIALSFDALTGLLMTLPRMLQTALDARFSDRSLRVVQRLGKWQLEQAEGDAGLILKLGTRDGFEIAFALNGEHACALGAALLTAPDTAEPTLVRRPH
ncbi:MAG TPA: hypothetical protein VND19_21245 [Acetobacteraceae bacterium]|nr:hypothetical protein [Acetobacteraceae bacterium]